MNPTFITLASMTGALSFRQGHELHKHVAEFTMSKRFSGSTCEENSHRRPI